MRCPECGRKIEDPVKPFRPFCSQRCKLLDLKKWISEEYRFSAAMQDESDNDATETEPPEET
jgi:uncharacterized protein